MCHIVSAHLYAAAQRPAPLHGFGGSYVRACSSEREAVGLCRAVGLCFPSGELQSRFMTPADVIGRSPRAPRVNVLKVVNQEHAVPR